MTLVQNYALLDTITFSSTSVGIATVTLSTLNWSEISGLRAGYRFLVDSNGGEAFVLDDPQFESKVLNVTIIKPLLTTIYTSGTWVLRVPRTKEVKDYLPRNARTSLILPEYLDSLQDVCIDELQDSIIRLRNIRRWNVMDPEFLDIFLQSLGMKFQTEEFDLETRRRFVKELPTFLELNGTRFFTNYLSFVVGALFTSVELWSKDYLTFIPYADIPILDLPLYYPTNHVSLSFDIDAFGVIEPALIISIFYTLASVPLVLHSINQELVSDNLLIIGSSIGHYHAMYTADET